jgi:4-hydroxythreonine-4-phosphate dehydrogenase
MPLQHLPSERGPIAVSMGDPSGIGPDVALLTWLARSENRCPVFFVTADVPAFEARVAMLPAASHLRIRRITRPEEAISVFSQAMPILQVSQPLEPVIAGSPSAAHAQAIIEAIDLAVSITISGRAAAVVTGPIAKHVLLRQGFRHAGHTEYLAELSKRQGFEDVFPVMLMASCLLKAVPVTVHMALKDIFGSLTQSRIVKTAEVTCSGLRRFFKVERPRLAICGLNPHAGENGTLGREEIEIIAPAIADLQARGILAAGPYPADTVFHEAARQDYDAVLAMYHDQALIPFKTLSFEDGVNVTLGLPFIMTSPDHGTAFSLAGTGHADPASFLEALRLASRMSLAASAHSSSP